VLTFYAIVFVFKTPSGPVEALGTVWSTSLLVAASAGVFATLSAPKRRDPDQSLVIEFWASVTLCIIFCWLEISLFWYRTETGAFAVNLFGAGLIFVIAFLARSIQIVRDRKDLRKFRANGPVAK
jgi:hypothetical protein